MRINKLILLISICFKFSHTYAADTTLTVAYEICSNGSLLGCSNAKENNFYQDNFLIFDGTLEGLLSSKKFLWFLYQPEKLDLELILKIFAKCEYFDSSYVFDSSKEQFMEFNQKIGENLFEYVHSIKKEPLIIRNTRIDRKLKKVKNLKKVREKGLYDFNDSYHREVFPLITSTRKYLIFEIECEIFNLKKTGQTLIVNDFARGSIDKFFTWCEADYYFLLSLFSIKNFSIKKYNQFDHIIIEQR